MVTELQYLKDWDWLAQGRQTQRLLEESCATETEDGIVLTAFGIGIDEGKWPRNRPCSPLRNIATGFLWTKSSFSLFLRCCHIELWCSAYWFWHSFYWHSPAQWSGTGTGIMRTLACDPLVTGSTRGSGFCRRTLRAGDQPCHLPAWKVTDSTHYTTIILFSLQFVEAN